MKVIKVTDEIHQYLMMQRALTGVTAGKQVEKLVNKERNNVATRQGLGTNGIKYTEQSANINNAGDEI